MAKIKFQIKVENKKKPGIRIPTAPCSFSFKDKKRYNRTVKHKKGLIS